MSEETKALARHFNEEVWNNKNLVGAGHRHPAQAGNPAPSSVNAGYVSRWHRTGINIRRNYI